MNNVVYPSVRVSQELRGSNDECHPPSSEVQVGASQTEDHMLLSELESPHAVDSARALELPHAIDCASSDPPPCLDVSCLPASSSSVDVAAHIRNLAAVGVSPRHAQWSTYLGSERLRTLLSSRGRGENSRGRGRRCS